MKSFTFQQRLALFLALFCVQFSILSAQTPSYQFLAEHSYGSELKALQVDLTTSSNVSSVSFSLNYDISNGSAWVDLGNSWLNQQGTASTAIEHDSTNQKIHITIARTSGGPISGSGEIGVVVLDRGGILDNMDIRGEAPFRFVGMEVSDPEVSIFPNPTSERVWVEADAPILSAMLVDLQGRTVRLHSGSGEERLEWQVRELPRGSYFLRLNTESGHLTKRLVLN